MRALKALVRLRAGQHLAVDEEGGRPGGAGLRPGQDVGVDRALALFGVERGREALAVETQLGRLLLEPLPPERRDVVGVEPIVHRPELPLRPGGAGRDRRRPGLLVKRQRHVAPDEPDLVRVLLPQARQRLLDARAERTLEVGPLDDGDRRVGGAARRRAGDVDADPDVGVGIGPGGRRVGPLVEAGLGERCVELAARRPGGQERVRLAELLVDRLLEHLDRLRAVERPAVDEEGRRPGDAEAARVVRVAREAIRARPAVEVGLPPRDVEPELRRVPVERRAIELGVVRVELVVHLPELPLLARRLGGQRRGHGVVVKRQRVVAEHQRQVGAVRLQQRVEGGLDPRAEGALKVGELDQGDLRLRAAAHRRVEGGDAEDGGAGRRAGAVRHRRLGPGQQRGVELVAREPAPQQAVGAGELVVDDLLEGGERLRAEHGPAVDEEARRPAHAELAAERQVVVDARLAGVAVERGAERRQIEPQLDGVLLQRRAFEVILSREQLVVHLPELPLPLGGHGGLGRQRARCCERGGGCAETGSGRRWDSRGAAGRAWGSTRPQNGHWKSENSTIVTFAVEGPRSAPPSGTAIRSTGGPSGTSAAAGGRDGAVAALLGPAATAGGVVFGWGGADAQPIVAVRAPRITTMRSFTVRTLSSRDRQPTARRSDNTGLEMPTMPPRKPTVRLEVEWSSEAWAELRTLPASERRPVMEAAARLAVGHRKPVSAIVNAVVEVGRQGAHELLYRVVGPLPPPLLRPADLRPRVQILCAIVTGTQRRGRRAAGRR